MTNSESFVKDYLASGDGGDLDLLGRYLHDDVILRHDVKEVVSSGSVVAARITVSGTLRGAFAGVSAEAGAFEVDQAGSAIGCGSDAAP